MPWCGKILLSERLTCSRYSAGMGRTTFFTMSIARSSSDPSFVSPLLYLSLFWPKWRWFSCILCYYFLLWISSLLSLVWSLCVWLWCSASACSLYGVASLRFVCLLSFSSSWATDKRGDPKTISVFRSGRAALSASDNFTAPPRNRANLYSMVWGTRLPLSAAPEWSFC